MGAMGLLAAAPNQTSDDELNSTRRSAPAEFTDAKLDRLVASVKELLVVSESLSPRKQQWR
jgi:hypothetical protein